MKPILFTFAFVEAQVDLVISPSKKPGLRACGLTTTRRDAQTIYYRLSDHEFLEKLRGSFFAEMETAFLSAES
jgi:DNA-binding transcriptional ArsR family regulator